jgi:hypothetical protein
LATIHCPDATLAVIAGLDPAIQTSSSTDLECRSKAHETSALLDRRVKPGDDGGAAANPGQRKFGLDRTAVGQARA